MSLMARWPDHQLKPGGFLLPLKWAVPAEAGWKVYEAPDAAHPLRSRNPSRLALFQQYCYIHNPKRGPTRVTTKSVGPSAKSERPAGIPLLRSIADMRGAPSTC